MSLIPSNSPISVQLLGPAPMKAGEQLKGSLIYPLYVDNRLVLPAGTAFRGRVVRLNPDRSRRIRSRIQGDFTPFHIPVVQFDQLVLPDGKVEAFVGNTTTDGIQLLSLSPPAAGKKKSFISRQFSAEKQRLKDTTDQISGPGKRDRLVQFLYSQLPYHPERIAAGTSWTFDLVQPLTISGSDDPPATRDEPAPVAAAAARKATAGEPRGTAPGTENKNQWRLHAYLTQTISSANQKPANTFQAEIAEPVFNPDHSIAVPQGSILVGQITQAKPARSFGRQGKLRFKFQELKLPSGYSQYVQGTLSGVDSNKSSDLKIDSEGGVQPQSQGKVIVPLVLTLLAGRALDTDGIQPANAAVASNGFGIVGRITGIVAGSRSLAAGIGFYEAGIAVYDHWLARGHDVVFVKETRIEVTTTPSAQPMPVSAPRK